MAYKDNNLSIVICSYTEARWDDMVSAIDSVKTQTVTPFEIIVVVDHNPAMLERVQKTIPDVIAIENLQARGLSGARNSGIAAAHGAVIGFLDDDAIAAPDWTQWLLQALQEPDVMGAGGVVKPLWSADKPNWFPEEFYWVLGCSYRGLPMERGAVRNLFGGCMCVRRELFERVGGFRTGIGRSNGRPMGCEETELCIRAFQQFPATKFVYEPRAWAWHRIIPGRASFSYFRERCYAEGLSKAKVSNLVGPSDALSAEFTYTLRTLSKGILRGVTDGFKGDLTGLQRAGAILAGLAFTGTGYLLETVSAVGARNLKPSTTPSVGAFNVSD